MSEQTIDISSLTPNSNVSKERAAEKSSQKKEVKAVVSGTAKQRKKSLSERFSETFLQNDAENVKTYLVWEVFIPAIKDLAFDVIENGAKMMLFGDNKPSSVQRGPRYGSGSYVSYQSYSDSPRSHRSAPNCYDRPARSNSNDILFESRPDAENVLDGMVEIQDRYDFVSMGDYKKLAGMRTTYTDDSIGWYALGTAKVVHVQGGFIIDLPVPVSADDSMSSVR